MRPTDKHITTPAPAVARPGAEHDREGAYAEEVGRLRRILGQVVALADDAPGLTNEQLRDQLMALADRASGAFDAALAAAKHLSPADKADLLGELARTCGMVNIERAALRVALLHRPSAQVSWGRQTGEAGEISP